MAQPAGRKVVMMPTTKKNEEGPGQPPTQPTQLFVPSAHTTLRYGFVVPALRKLREGRGIHFVADAIEVKSMGQPPFITSSKSSPPGRYCESVQFCTDERSLRYINLMAMADVYFDSTQPCSDVIPAVGGPTWTFRAR
jgi:hypothetical protein